MTQQTHSGAMMPLSSLVAAHGPWRVILAALIALLRQAAGVNTEDVDRLPDHIRKDIGLPPAALRPSPRPLSGGEAISSKKSQRSL